MKQIHLFPKEERSRITHKFRKGKRKTQRALAKGRPIHLGLKSRWILISHYDWIEAKIREYANKFGIKIHKHAVCGDHIHFAIQIPSRDQYRKFIRAFTGVVAKKMGKGMWRVIPWTKIYRWGIPFKKLVEYIQKNYEETWVLRKYEPRRRNYPKNHVFDPPAELSPNIGKMYL